MKRTLSILAVTVIAVGVLGAPADAKKAKNCGSEQWCKKAISSNQTYQAKRGNDWERPSFVHHA